MKQKLSIIRYLALAAIVAVALAFGAKQAPADAECRECTEPPPTACLAEPDPEEFCYQLCVIQNGCYDSLCHQSDQCYCATK
jgi:hypothetical protein